MTIETKSGIADIFKAEVKTLGEEIRESDAKFEIGKSYFVMDLRTLQTDTIKVEARTAKMLTGNTAEGTRKYRVFENVRGEFVKIRRDDDGYDIYIYAKNEFTPANVEAAKKSCIEDAARLGINTAAETDDSEVDAEEYAISPEALDVATNAEIELANQIVTNEINNAETDDSEDDTESDCKFVATQITFPNGYEGEPTVEVSATFDNLDDAARFIADDNPIIRDGKSPRRAYADYYFGGIFFAGWKIERDGKILCEVDFLGNTHGDNEIDSLVCKYCDENDNFIIPDVPGFLDAESQDDYKEFKPRLEIVKATFDLKEIHDAKEILAPLADKADVELGELTLGDSNEKTCTVNIEVKGSINAIEKFKALLDGRKPEPPTPTNAKKFIKAAADDEAEIERKPVKPAGKTQQVAAIGKEVVAAAKATTLASNNVFQSSTAQAGTDIILTELKEKKSALREKTWRALKNRYVKLSAGSFFPADEAGFTTVGIEGAKPEFEKLYRNDNDEFVEVPDKEISDFSRLELQYDIVCARICEEIARTQFKFTAGNYYADDDGNKFYCVKRTKKFVTLFDCCFIQDDGFMDLNFDEDCDEDDAFERKIFKRKIQFDERGEFVDWYEGEPDEGGDRELVTVLAKNITAPPKPDSPDTESKPEADAFTAELEKITAEQSAAKKILDEKEAELIKAQDAWRETNYAITNLYRAKAEELSAKLLPLPMDVLEVKTQKGFTPFIYTETLSISFEGGKFTIRGECPDALYDFDLACYDTPRQVESAINGLKATVALGGDRFTFPTAKEMIV